MSDDSYRCEVYNVEEVIKVGATACTFQDEPLNPLEVVSMEEAKEIWNKVIPLEDGCYFFTDDTFTEFLGRLQARAMDIAMKRLVDNDNGLVVRGHDGEDIRYWLKKGMQ